IVATIRHVPILLHPLAVFVVAKVERHRLAQVTNRTKQKPNHTNLGVSSQEAGFRSEMNRSERKFQWSIL
ncbi:MAG: hypothetical protein LBL81_03915, partial [Tannerella sp.]|nr:hypothetical protein [Tannerella sp.]